jgi:TP901 family phage tail tape measure protein
MSKTDVNFRIGGDSSPLERELRRSKGHVDRYSNGVVSQFRRLESRVAQHLKRGLVNPITGLVAAGSILAMSRQVMEYNANLTRMGIQGGISADEQMRLKGEMLDVAYASGQSRDAILQGLNAIVQRTGDLGFARDVMKDMAIASTATGASMEDLGALASNLQQKLRLGKGEIMSAFNILTVQGKAGAFTLEDMARMGERLFSAAKRLDVSGLDDVRKIGAFAQIARMGTGSSEQATTAVERSISNILAKQKEIENLGVNVKDNGKVRAFDELIKDIIAATKGDEGVLGKLFGEEGIRAVSIIASAYRETGGFDLFDKLMRSDVGREGELLKDFARYSGEAKFQWQVLATAATEFADTALGPVIKSASDALKEMTGNPDKMAAFRAEIVTTATAVAELAKLLMALTWPARKIMQFWGTYYEWADTIAEKDGGMTAGGQVLEKYRIKWNMIPEEKRRSYLEEAKAGGRPVNIMKAVVDYERDKRSGSAPIAAKNDVDVNVYIDTAARVRTDSTSSGGAVSARVNLPRGSFAHE